MLFKDLRETARRQFKDAKSYVRLDGSEVLFGKDWKERVRQLAIRCDGRCEELVDVRNGSYIRCGREAHHPHHIVKRSDYRDDRLLGLQALCSFHHKQYHPEKQVQWTKNRRQTESCGS